MRYLRFVATAAAVAVLSACGGSADPATAPPPPVEVAEPTPPTQETEPSTEVPQLDACALVPKADAEKLADTPLEDPVPVRDTCTYSGPASGPLAQVEIYVGDGAKKILDIDRDLDHEFETLAGVGDEAYLEDGAVFVNAAGVWVAIRLVRLDDPARYRKPLTELARTVAGRL
ncbi:hypothetical protein [Micromonospora lutea]|uniref:DUF3558 domain-containing protein n=1 Tax=Micromonospora lutea TaxID=419825 RepID=A0ABQ4IX29_9ACTN|nr:hypothetical protein [Micromonospora lutea]GIJ22468.1 hypothetical protein Vlu01_30920 [Micromonospora lutea]